MRTFFPIQLKAIGLYCGLTIGQLAFAEIVLQTFLAWGACHLKKFHRRADGAGAVILRERLHFLISSTSKASGLAKGIRIGFGIVLVAALTGSLSGCASYADAGYGGYYDDGYYDGWWPDTDVYVLGGSYGPDAYSYSHRGWGSRGGGHGGCGGGGHYGGGGGHFGGGGHGGGGHR
jgi:hypothetical protein